MPESFLHRAEALLVARFATAGMPHVEASVRLDALTATIPSAHSLCDLAFQAAQRGELARAQALYADGLARFPDHRPLLSDAARFLTTGEAAGSDPARALALARQAVLLGHGAIWLRDLLAEALTQAGQWDEAQQENSRVLERWPDHPAATERAARIAARQRLPGPPASR